MKKLLMAILGVASAFSALATDYTWTGAAGDGKWTTPGNWKVGADVATTCPNGVADVANFGIAATVDVDGSSDITMKQIIVSSAVTVTLNRSAAAQFDFNDATAGYQVVPAGSKLVINVPTVTNKRFDVSGAGTIEWNSVFSRPPNQWAYFYCSRLDMGSGFSHVEQWVTADDVEPVFGMGNSRPFTFNLLGSAQLNLAGKSFKMVSGSSNSAGVVFVQDGAETLIANKTDRVSDLNFYVNYNGATAGKTYKYTLKNGTVNIVGDLIVGRGAGGGEYVQEGGNATFHGSLSPTYGSVYLRGGTLTTDGGVKVADGGAGCFQMEGGTLNLHGAVQSAFTVSGGVLKLSDVLINEPITMTGGAFVPGESVAFGENGKIVLSGDARVQVDADCTWAELQAALAPLEIEGPVAFTADHPVTVTFPAGSTVADFNGGGQIRVAIADGATIPDGVTIRAGSVVADGAQALDGKVRLVLATGTHAYADLAALNPKSVELDGASLTYTASDVIDLPIKLTKTVIEPDSAIRFGENGKFIYNGCQIKVAGTSSYADLVGVLYGAMKGEGSRFGLLTDTSATLNITSSLSLPDALEVGSNVTISVAANVQLTAATDTIPTLVIRNGGKFLLYNQSAYIATPIDLTLDEGSQLVVDAGDPGFARTMIVAHSFTLKGVKKSRGRTPASTTGEFRCNDSSSASSNYIYVPYTWTGAGDGKTVSALDNWEDGAWAASNADVAYDFSRATGPIEFTGDCAFGGIAYLPPATRDGSSLKLVNAEGKDILFSMRGDSLKERIICRQGCTIDFDIDYKNCDSINRAPFGGGGTYVFRRNVNQSGVDNYFSVGGAVEIAGTLTTGSGNLVFTEWYRSVGYLRFVEGADVDLTGYITLDHNEGFTSGHGYRQTGGDVTAKGVVMTVAIRPSGAANNNYVLEGGTLTLTEQLALGSAHPLWPEKQVNPSGYFEMYGGTLTTPIVKNEVNLNYCRLFGGDVYLGAGGFVRTVSSQKESLTQTEVPLTLGAVTLHAADSSWSVDQNLLASLVGGTAFDVAAEKTVAVACPVSGEGGVTKQGEGALVFSGSYAATGDIRLEAGTLAFADNADLSLDRVEAYDLSKLSIKSGTTVTTKMLSVNGVYQANGTYDLASGQIVVAGGPVVWTDGTGDHKWNTRGNWNGGALPTAADSVFVPAGTATIGLGPTAAVGIVKDLTVESGALRFDGLGSLEFAGSAALDVPSGASVTFATNTTVVVSCQLVKTGAGYVLLEGALANAVDPAQLRWPSPLGTNEFRVVEGEAEIRGEVLGLRVYPCSNDAAVMPRLTIGEGADCTGCCFVHGPWAGYYGTGYGEVVMNGGLVSLNGGVGVFSFWGRPPESETSYVAGKYGFCFFKTGHGRFIQNGGTFTGLTGAWTDAVFNLRNTNSDGGETEIIINGGEMNVRNCLVFGTQNAAVDTLTLNGGKLSVGKLSAGSGQGRKIVRLNGGEFHALAAPNGETKSVDGQVVCGIDESYWVDDGGWKTRGRAFDPVVIGGDVRFTQEDATVECEIGPRLDFRYEGAKLIGDGFGALRLRYAPDGDFAVQFGSVGRIGLDFDGVKEVECVMRGKRIKPAGDYGVGGLYPETFPGGGIFRARTGEPARGLLLIVH